MPGGGSGDTIRKWPKIVTKMAKPTLSEKDKCPKCNDSNTLEKDPEGDLHCWGCGTTFKMSYDDRLLARHRFYEENKAAILADIKSIGTSATAKKWKINGASLHHVLKRWEREASDKVQKTATSQDKIIPTASSDGKLPPFPVFSDSWTSPVQLKWLEIYEKLRENR